MTSDVHLSRRSSAATPGLEEAAARALAVAAPEVAATGAGAAAVVRARVARATSSDARALLCRIP